MAMFLQLSTWGLLGGGQPDSSWEQGARKGHRRDCVIQPEPHLGPSDLA